MYEAHVERGGRMVEFAGFLMPVLFDGIVAEHNRVRNRVGLFDVSHMGEIEIIGPQACGFTDYVVSNNVDRLDEGQICYTVCCNDDGHVLDDLLVYKFSGERVLLVVNAVNTAKIVSHLNSVAGWDVEIENTSARIGQIAVQGPLSRELLLSSHVFSSIGNEIEKLSYYRFFTFEHGGSEVIISRTGYTGELGYEVYMPAGGSLGVWNELLDAGEGLGVTPIGLGARDTLRFEPCYCLYGHELDEEISPLEAGLSWVVKFKKGDFIGKSALQAEKEAGSVRTLAGFEIEGRGIARQGFRVMLDGNEIGGVTSGTFSPTLGKSLALALIGKTARVDSDNYSIDIRGKPVPARRVELPFYKSRSTD